MSLVEATLSETVIKAISKVTNTTTLRVNFFCLSTSVSKQTQTKRAKWSLVDATIKEKQQVSRKERKIYIIVHHHT